MRCHEVIRELARPTEAADPLAVERHLAACTACSAEASASRRLDILWNATRPILPPESTWQALWSRVEAGAEEAPVRLAATDSNRSRRGSLAAIWAIAAVAQAAAVLLAAWLLFHRPTQPQAPGGDATVAATQPSPVQVDFEFVEGQTLFLVLDQRGDRMVVKPELFNTSDLVAYDGDGPDSFAFDEAAQFSMIVLNALEGLE